MAKTVIGLFDDRANAERALQELRENGFNREDISLIGQNAAGDYTKDIEAAAGDTAKRAGTGAAIGGIAGFLVGLAAFAIPGIGPIIAAGPLAMALAGAGIGAVAGGIIGALTKMGVPEEEAKHYAEAVRRGGTLVAVKAAEDRVDQAVDILNRFGAVDINRRVTEWQRAGWTDFNPNAQPMTSEELARERERYRTREAARTDELAREREHSRTREATPRETKIPVTQEDVQIGKRAVERGGVRVYSYITEQPVEKTVPLREEHIKVERHPVDRPANESDLQAFKEGSIEVRETTEEPVVNKRARVTEEVVVKKEVGERQETVRDKVRRSDVKVAPIGGRSASPSSGFERYDTDFRKNFESTYAKSGLTYDQYDPAYRYGYTLGTDPRYSRGDWSTIEPEARREWETRYAKVGPWDRFKDAVRYAWDRVRGRAA